MFKQLFNKVSKFFAPRRVDNKEQPIAPPNAVPVNPSGFKLNRKQRRQFLFGKMTINNCRRHTKGRKQWKPVHQIIKLKDENGNYTGQIKQIYHYPKAI